MPWSRFDDKTPQHPKLLRLPRADRWTWFEVISYCNAYRTEGRIPTEIPDALSYATSAFLKLGHSAGLFDEKKKGVYVVHDFEEYSGPVPDRVRKQQQRERAALNGKAT